MSHIVYVMKGNKARTVACTLSSTFEPDLWVYLGTTLNKPSNCEPCLDVQRKVEAVLLHREAKRETPRGVCAACGHSKVNHTGIGKFGQDIPKQCLCGCASFVLSPADRIPPPDILDTPASKNLLMTYEEIRTKMQKEMIARMGPALDFGPGSIIGALVDTTANQVMEVQERLNAQTLDTIVDTDPFLRASVADAIEAVKKNRGGT